MNSRKNKAKKAKAKKEETGKKEIKVVNIVVSTSLHHDIPLEKMAATLSNTEYNPEQLYPSTIHKPNQYVDDAF